MTLCHKGQEIFTWGKKKNDWNGNEQIYLLQEGDVFLNICPWKEVEAET